MTSFSPSHLTRSRSLLTLLLLSFLLLSADGREATDAGGEEESQSDCEGGGGRCHRRRRRLGWGGRGGRPRAGPPPPSPPPPRRPQLWPHAGLWWLLTRSSVCLSVTLSLCHAVTLSLCHALSLFVACRFHLRFHSCVFSRHTLYKSPSTYHKLLPTTDHQPSYSPTTQHASIRPTSHLVPITIAILTCT